MIIGTYKKRFESWYQVLPPPALLPSLTDTRRPTTASMMLPASDAVGVATSSVMTLRYMDELRLSEAAAPAASGGSLKGDSSIGLTGVESENGFLVAVGECGSW
jgi:hypothetical protein